LSFVPVSVPTAFACLLLEDHQEAARLGSCESSYDDQQQ
jgi:hypothetical protein